MVDAHGHSSDDSLSCQRRLLQDISINKVSSQRPLTLTFKCREFGEKAVTTDSFILILTRPRYELGSNSRLPGHEANALPRSHSDQFKMHVVINCFDATHLALEVSRGFFRGRI